MSSTIPRKSSVAVINPQISAGFFSSQLEDAQGQGSIGKNIKSGFKNSMKNIWFMGCFWECSIMFLEFQLTIWFDNFTPELLLRRCWKVLIPLEGITFICQECPSGSFQVSGASVSCTPCPAGSYQNETGSLACNRCPVGQYQDEEGQRDCKLCPAGATTLLLGSNSILDCGCKAGSINVASVATNVTSKALECIPCQEGFDCPFSSSIQALLTGLAVKLDWHPACHLHLVGFSGHFQWFKDYSRFRLSKDLPTSTNCTKLLLKHGHAMLRHCDMKQPSETAACGGQPSSSEQLVTCMHRVHCKLWRHINPSACNARDYLVVGQLDTKLDITGCWTQSCA